LEDELSNILCQRAYIQQLLGQKDEATEIYNKVLKTKPSDETVVAIADNNLVALKKDGSLFDSQKKLKHAAALEAKLTSEQKKVINYNRALVSLFMNKVDECREQVNSLMSEYPEEYRYTILKSSLLYKEKKFDESLKVLEDFKKKNGKNDDLLDRYMTQLYLNSGRDKDALQLIQKNIDNSESEELVSAAVSLYVRSGDVTSAVKCVVAYAERIIAKKANSVDDIRILRDIADFLISKESHAQAANILERLFKSTNDVTVLGQLVIAYSHFDTKSAEQYGDKLGAIRVEDDGDIDVEALENIAAPRLSVKASDNTNNNIQVKEKEKKKKKKKKILPKNLDKTLDPERWLPYKERSYYRKKKGKYGALEKGSQGVTEKKVVGKPGAPTTTAPAAATAAVPPVKQAAAPQTQSKPNYKGKRGRR